MELMQRLLRTLFPRGRAWRLPNFWQVIIDGWAVGLSDVKLWIGQVKAQIHPKSSDQALSDWQRLLGIVQDESLTLEQRRAQLEAIDVASGGQDLVYINGILRIVYPFCFVERLPVNNVLGNREARCGVARCSGGQLFDEHGNVLGSERYLYYVKGFVRDNEQQGIEDLIARLCPAHMQPIWLVKFYNQEDYSAKSSFGRG